MGTPLPFGDAPLEDLTAARRDPSTPEAVIEGAGVSAGRGRFEASSGGATFSRAAALASRSWASKFFRRVFSLVHVGFIESVGGCMVGRKQVKHHHLEQQALLNRRG